MKESKKENKYYDYDQSLNNNTNPFIKELNKLNNIKMEPIEEKEGESSEEIENQPENQDKIKKIDDKFIEKINLIGDKTKKTNDYYYQCLKYAGKNL